MPAPTTASSMLGAMGPTANGAGFDVVGAEPALAVLTRGHTICADRTGADRTRLDAARQAHIPIAAMAGVQTADVDEVFPVAQGQGLNGFPAVMTGQGFDLSGVQILIYSNGLLSVTGGQGGPIVSKRGQHHGVTEGGEGHS